MTTQRESAADCREHRNEEASVWPHAGITGTSQPGPSPPTSDAIGEEVQSGLSSGLHILGQQELER